jgi:A/G-specific adenine glycosylase
LRVPKALIEVPMSSAAHLPATFRKQLLAWFAKHQRDLPWRAPSKSDKFQRDPYHVWLAEIMLQQTQVTTVIPYYLRWLQRFPTLQDLAAATLDDVLKLWEGLGYYARARNFHKAAQHVVHAHNGHIPNSVDELMLLPGVGRYTAGAIASLAFGKAAPILDGNVKRILARLFAIDGSAAQRRALAQTFESGHVPIRNETELLWALSAWLLHQQRAREFNEALMDLGSLVCTPRTPHCHQCPLRAQCAAHAQGQPTAYPIPKSRTPVPHRQCVSAVLTDADGNMLLGQRPSQGLLGGLWEFIGGDINATDAPFDQAALRLALALLVQTKTGLRIAPHRTVFLGCVQHAFTHFKQTKHVFWFELARHKPKLRTAVGAYQQLQWLTRPEIAELALTRSDRKILALVPKQ